MKQCKKAFTLIELLVVIAIIAILSAILFPVFAQAREKARQTGCINNLKQLGLAFMQYTQDYDERFPASDQYGSKWAYLSLRKSDREFPLSRRCDNQHNEGLGHVLSRIVC